MMVATEGGHKSKRVTKKIALIIASLLAVAGIAVVTVIFLNSPWSPFYQAEQQSNDTIYEGRSELDNQAPTAQETEEYVVAADLPRYMSIPAIGVDRAHVEQIGTSGDNHQLGDPQNVHNVGWYQSSVKPGGEAIGGTTAGLYDGHNTGVYERGVFFNLGNLQYGDEIIIERGDGEIFRYAVRENNLMSVDDVTTQVMNTMLHSVEDGVEGLNIITCGGNWDEERYTYTHRVMLRAVRIE